MLLFALQTTSAAANENQLDAITLILVAGFIVSMTALAMILRRRDSPDDVPAESIPLPAPAQDAVDPQPEWRTRPRTVATPSDSTPAWLHGVSFPESHASVTDASQVIESLLAARRANDLPSGFALYTPAFLERQGEQSGIDSVERPSFLAGARFQGESPMLRSIEMVNANRNMLTVRAGYDSGSPELYRLVFLEGHWLIDSIEPA